MDTTPLCMFLRLKLYFAEIVDLVGLHCLAANHMRWDYYAVTYADK